LKTSLINRWHAVVTAPFSAGDIVALVMTPTSYLL
jgi:hypothetical protein